MKSQADNFKKIMKAGWGWIVLGTVIGIAVALLVILAAVFINRFIRGGTSAHLACKLWSSKLTHGKRGKGWSVTSQSQEQLARSAKTTPSA